MTHIFDRKKLDDVGAKKLPKITSAYVTLRKFTPDLKIFTQIYPKYPWHYTTLGVGFYKDDPAGKFLRLSCSHDSYYQRPHDDKSEDGVLVIIVAGFKDGLAQSRGWWRSQYMYDIPYISYMKYIWIYLWIYLDWIQARVDGNPSI